MSSTFAKASTPGVKKSKPPGPAARPAPAAVVPVEAQPLLDGEILQRKCACGGGCPSCQEDLLQRQGDDGSRSPQHEEAEDIPPSPASPTIRPALTISQPNDRYEQEADRVAEHVVRRLEPSPAPGPWPGRAAPDLQRACDECKIAPPTNEELEEDKTEGAAAPSVSRKAETGSASVSRNASPGGLLRGLERSQGAGRPLPTPVRREMEEGFGQDFGDVRIHTGGSSTAMSRSIQAKAFTYRNNIFFNEGRYAPHTEDGRLLLAHELTHVIQQGASRSPRTRIQRAAEMKIGNWAHSQIQDRLRGMDKKLITEAPIPGGTRHGKKHNSIGFADLYKAEKQTMSGISAQEPSESKDLEEAYKFFKYVNMRSDYKDKADSMSPVGFGPRITNHKKNIWSFKPNFPSNFHIGEIKPLFVTDFPTSAMSLSAGISQEGDYREGFEEFVARVYRDNPAHQTKLPRKITGRSLNLDDSKIPHAINYRRFETERSTHGKGAILKRDTKQRVWIYQVRSGVVFYFLVRDPYTKTEFPKAVDKQLGRLDPLLVRVRAKHPKMKSTLMPKSLDSVRHRRLIPAPVVHRQTAAGVQAKGTDWKKVGQAWERDRKNWVKGQGTGVEKPKEFLKEEAQGVEKKAKIDDKLGLRPTGKLGKQAKQVKKIRFWSGFKGRILGALRFRFGRVFDKVAGFFGKVKEKFRKHQYASNKLIEKKGIFSGWKKVATRAIIGFAVTIFKEMLVQAFSGFIHCINGVVGAILGKFTYAVDEAKKELSDELEPICCQIIGFKKELEEEYKKHEQIITTFTEAVATIREWRDILSTVETAIRLGVQVVSCGTPPALGCLWGLVAQLGISAGLSLLARTDYFDEEIAKPAARRLMSAIVGDSLHNFLIEQLEKTPLKPFLDEARDCRRRHSATGRTEIGGNLDKLDPNDTKIAQARKEWEKEFGPQILADLQRVFQAAKGKRPTREDLQKLVDLIRQSGKSPEEIKALLEAARDPASGKIDLAKASGNVEKGGAPKGQPKERDIDYEKAKRRNPELQKALGWKPETFYPKPGVDPGSEEFATAVYDLQEALRIKADGLLGEKTLIAFYKRNKLKKDDAYKEAVRVRKEKQAAFEKARQEREEKKRTEAAEDEAAKGQEKKGGGKNMVAVPVTQPPAGTRIVEYGDLNDELQSSPGWIGIPLAVVSPALGGDKTSYQPGERLSLNIVYWNRKVQKWVWFTDIPGQFKTMSSLNEKRTLTYLQREDFYFKLTADSQYVYREKKGTFVVSIDW